MCMKQMGVGGMEETKNRRKIETCKLHSHSRKIRINFDSWWHALQWMKIPVLKNRFIWNANACTRFTYHKLHSTKFIRCFQQASLPFLNRTLKTKLGQVYSKNQHALFLNLKFFVVFIFECCLFVHNLLYNIICFCFFFTFMFNISYHLFVCLLFNIVWPNI